MRYEMEWLCIHNRSISIQTVTCSLADPGEAYSAMPPPPRPGRGPSCFLPPKAPKTFIFYFYFLSKVNLDPSEKIVG